AAIEANGDHLPQTVPMSGQEPLARRAIAPAGALEELLRVRMIRHHRWCLLPHDLAEPARKSRIFLRLLAEDHPTGAWVRRITAPKGPQHISPGQRPGTRRNSPPKPCKGGTRPPAPDGSAGVPVSP